MFPQTPEQAAHGALSQQQRFQMRYGCIAARIGADISHKLGIDMPVHPPEYGTATNIRSATHRRGGRNAQQFVMGPDPRQQSPHGGAIQIPKAVKAGSRVVLTVEDITRYPDEAEKAHWVCHHPECRGEKFASKAELLQHHRPNKELQSAQETHMYYAVFESPETPARPEKRNGDKVVEPAREAEPARVLLLSDEE